MPEKKTQAPAGKRFVTFLIEQDLYDLVAQRARAEERTVSQALRMIVRAHFKDEVQDLVRRYERKGAKAAAAASSRTPGA